MSEQEQDDLSIEHLRQRISKMTDDELRALSEALRCRAGDFLEAVDLIDRQLQQNEAQRKKDDAQRSAN